MDYEFIPPKLPLVQVFMLVDFDSPTEKFVKRINEILKNLHDDGSVVRSVRCFNIHHCVIEYEVVPKEGKK